MLDKDEVLQLSKEFTRKILIDDEIEFDEELRLEDIDSFAAIRVSLALEDHFGVEFLEELHDFEGTTWEEFAEFVVEVTSGGRPTAEGEAASAGAPDGANGKVDPAAGLDAGATTPVPAERHTAPQLGDLTDAELKRRLEHIVLRHPKGSEFEMIADWLRSGASRNASLMDMERRPLDPTRLRNAFYDQRGMDFRIVEEKDSGRPVGLVQMDAVGHGAYELGVMVVDEGKWRRGLGMEAAMKAIDLLFMSYNAHRVQFRTTAYNPHILSVLTFHLAEVVALDGILREAVYLDGEYHDVLIWSILRDEYFADDGYSGSERKLDERRTETVPAHEKEEARVMLAGYLADNPRTSVHLRQREGGWAPDGAALASKSAAGTVAD